MRNKSLLGAVLFGVAAAAVASENAGEPSLTRIQQILTGKKLVDLTHAFEPGVPHWPGFPDEKRETIYWYEKGRGSMGAGFLRGGLHARRPMGHTRGSAGALREGAAHRRPDRAEGDDSAAGVIDVHEEAAKNRITR
jgi:hypothetical protein